MNILVTRFPFESAMGGLEKHTLTLVDSLGKRDFKFFLLSSCPILRAEFKKRNLPSLKPLAGKDPVSRGALIKFCFWFPFFTLEMVPLLFYFRVFKKCKRLFCLSLAEKLVLTPIARLLGYKVVWMEHTLIDNWLTLNPLKFLYRWWSRQVKIVAISFAIKKQLVEIGVDSERVVVIHNGIDQAAFAAGATPSPRYKKTFVVGYVGRLSKEKGLSTLLQAVKIARDVIPNLRVILVGDGSEKSDLRWLAKNIGIDSLVQFVGWQEQPAKWLVNFDLVVLPSTRREAFGIVLLEAMALGKPVVASRVGGIPEVVEQNKTGLLVEAGNHEMLAQAIINLYNQPDSLKQFGENGRNRALEFFSLAKMLNKFDELLG